MRLLLLAIAFLTACPSHAQTLVLRTKPIQSEFLAADLLLMEVKLYGRKPTDAATKHAELATIPIKGFTWISILTMRFTVMVPVAWEVQSLGVKFTPQVATGMKWWTLETVLFPIPYQAPAGQMLAIDVNQKTGEIFLGPVAAVVVTPPPQPPSGANKPGDTSPPLTQLVAADGAVWKLANGQVLKNDANTVNPYSPSVVNIYISAGNCLRATASNGVYTSWNGTSWAGSC